MAVIQSGLVGVSVTFLFPKKISVTGYDLKQDRIRLMKKYIDQSHGCPLGHNTIYSLLILMADTNPE